MGGLEWLSLNSKRSVKFTFIPSNLPPTTLSSSAFLPTSSLLYLLPPMGFLEDFCVTPASAPSASSTLLISPARNRSAVPAVSTTPPNSASRRTLGSGVTTPSKTAEEIQAAAAVGAADGWGTGLGRRPSLQHDITMSPIASAFATGTRRPRDDDDDPPPNAAKRVKLNELVDTLCTERCLTDDNQAILRSTVNLSLHAKFITMFSFLLALQTARAIVNRLSQKSPAGPARISEKKVGPAGVPTFEIWAFQRSQTAHSAPVPYMPAAVIDGIGLCFTAY